MSKTIFYAMLLDNGKHDIKARVGKLGEKFQI